MKSITSKVLFRTGCEIHQTLERPQQWVLTLELQLLILNNITDPFATQQYPCLSFWTETHNCISLLAKKLLYKVITSFEFVVTRNVPPYILKLIL